MEDEGKPGVVARIFIGAAGKRGSRREDAGFAMAGDRGRRPTDMVGEERM